MFDLNGYLEEKRKWVDAALDRFLPAESERPALLHQAMRYSLFGGGKRVRPILCMASAEAVGGTAEAAILAAAALECVHAYTLICDDLPSMDNDDLRRGQPALHKAFGEANAILAGASLFALGFELLAQAPDGARLALELARASGSRGVAGGQFEDLVAEGNVPDAARVHFIHTHKTAKLIQAACRMGGVAARVNETVLEALGRYGERVGLAFQVVDDILNATSNRETLGKAAGSDDARSKMTWVALAGLDQARRQAEELMEEAIDGLKILPGATEPLAALARYVVRRQA